MISAIDDLKENSSERMYGHAPDVNVQGQTKRITTTDDVVVLLRSFVFGKTSTVENEYNILKNIRNYGDDFYENRYCRSWIFF